VSHQTGTEVFAEDHVLRPSAREQPQPDCNWLGLSSLYYCSELGYLWSERQETIMITTSAFLTDRWGNLRDNSDWFADSLSLEAALAQINESELIWVLSCPPPVFSVADLEKLDGSWVLNARPGFWLLLTPARVLPEVSVSAELELIS
jgi:hypothetical protein